MADSWLTDGNCEECRRNKFCSKPCKAHKQRTMSILHSVVLRSMMRVQPNLNEVLHKVAADTISHDVDKFRAYAKNGGR